MRKAEFVTIDEPFMPIAHPRQHQQEALIRYKDKDEIALFFEMGCGKSLTLLRIAESKFLNGEIEGLLVIAPNDVHRQWYDELVNGIGEKMWSEKLHEWKGMAELSVAFQAQCYGGRGGADKLYPFDDETHEYREVVRDGVSVVSLQHKYFWFLSVNVDTFSTKDKWKHVVEWANSHRIMIAIDEATVIKNPKSLRSQRILYEFNKVVKNRGRIISSRKINPCRAVLTGTPVTNGPCDMWSIMEFLRPNYFGMSWWTFRDYYAMFTQLQARGERSVSVLLTEQSWKGIKSCDSYEEARQRWGCSDDTYLIVMGQKEYAGPYKHADDLRKRIEPVSMFKLLTECEDMPEQNYITRHCGMSAEQSKLYKQAMKEMAVEHNGAVMTAQNILVLYLRLQQISSGFVVNGDSLCIDDESDLMPGDVVWIGDTVPKLDAIMKDIDECSKPLLILTRYTAEAQKIYELCKDRYRTGLFTGWKVVGGVDAFKKGELDVLVANSQKIARGFNLQIAHTTLFYSNTFSMEIRQQSEFRTFRLGQKSPCLYVDYIASPVDEKIMDSLKMKKNLLDYIREQDKINI